MIDQYPELWQILDPLHELQDSIIRACMYIQTHSCGIFRRKIIQILFPPENYFVILNTIRQTSFSDLSVQLKREIGTQEHTDS